MRKVNYEDLKVLDAIYKQLDSMRNVVETNEIGKEGTIKEALTEALRAVCNVQCLAAMDILHCRESNEG